MEFWPDAVIQDCVIHKERNIYPHLRKSDHEECGRLFKRLRPAEGSQAGMEALQDLRKFLKARNTQALVSLEKSGERLTTLQKLSEPATLNTSLQSTNLIETAIHNCRRQTSRVTRWNPKGDPVERRRATAFLWVERGFRKIKGRQEIGQLVKALARV
jgi:putative transposase